jgi:hypothetical protein
MNIMDYLGLYAEVKAEEQAIISEGDTSVVGGTISVDLPHAERFSALLVKGHAGKRFRAISVVFRRES